MAESYIQESSEERVKIARKVFGGETASEVEKVEITNKSTKVNCASTSSSSDHTFQFTNNCTFNFWYNYCKNYKLNVIWIIMQQRIL